MAAKQSTVAPRAPQSTRPPFRAETLELPLRLIDVPPSVNPRRDFPEDEIGGLAESILDVGQLQAIIVRPVGKRYELIAGERRFRAATVAQLETIMATVRKVDDRGAAELRLLENLHRRDLNPIEVAIGLRDLERLGHTAKTLATLTQRPASAIEARLRLLQLPSEWQERVRTGELREDFAEMLAPWAEFDDVLSVLDDAYLHFMPMPILEWRRRLVSAVFAISRAIDPDQPDGPQFEPTAEQLERLDVRTMAIKPGETALRAMNVALWDELQDGAAPLAGTADSTEYSARNHSRPYRRTENLAPPRLSDVAADEGNTLEASTAEDTADGEARRDWLMAQITERLERSSLDELEALAGQLLIDVGAFAGETVGAAD